MLPFCVHQASLCKCILQSNSALPFCWSSSFYIVMARAIASHVSGLSLVMSHAVQRCWERKLFSSGGIICGHLPLILMHTRTDKHKLGMIIMLKGFIIPTNLYIKYNYYLIYYLLFIQITCAVQCYIMKVVAVWAWIILFKATLIKWSFWTTAISSVREYGTVTISSIENWWWGDTTWACINKQCSITNMSYTWEVLLDENFSFACYIVEILILVKQTFVKVAISRKISAW